MAKFIGYFIGDDGKGFPVCAGGDKQACFDTLVQRVIIVGTSHGALVVQDREDVNDEAFAEIVRITDQAFADVTQEMMLAAAQPSNHLPV